MNFRLIAAALACFLFVSIARGQPDECSVDGHGFSTVESFDSWTGDYDATDSQWNADIRPAKPIVEMLEAGDEAKIHRSAENPNHWIPVAYGTLTFRAIPPDDVAWDGCEFFLDGQPWLRDSQGPAENIEWHCPSLGRHLVQTRYRINDLWSRISDPIRFEILPPPRPEIIAVADTRDVPLPVAGKMISIRTDNVVLKLANVRPNSHVAVYLNGESVGPAVVNDGCCATMNLREFVEAGVHAVSVRSISNHANCGVASDASPEILIHYYCPHREVADVRHRNTKPSQCQPVVAKKSEVNVTDIVENVLPGLLKTATPPASGNAVLKATREIAQSQARIAEAQARAKAAESQARAEVEKARAAADAAKAASQADADKAEAAASVGRAKAESEAAKAQAAAEAEKARAAAEAVKANAAAGIATPPAGPQAAPANPKASPPNPPSGSGASHSRDKNLDDDKAQNENSDRNRQEFCFFSPAKFPRREYGQKGETVDAAGLIIFEGMTLTIDTQGNFNLSFHTNTPEVPVTLRLQLLVKLKYDCAWHTITFDPIRVAGRYDRRDNAKDQELQHHVRSGEIAALRGLATKGSTQILEIQREGSARFGYDRADVQYSVDPE